MSDRDNEESSFDVGHGEDGWHYMKLVDRLELSRARWFEGV